MLQNLWRYREITGLFARRHVQSRYRGSYLGILWALITPLLTLGVYTLVFGALHGASWRGSDRSGMLDFAAHMFVGIVLYGIFAECASRAPLLIVQNPNYVKKMIFPLEVLPVSLLGAATMHSLLGMLAELLCVLLSRGSLPWTVAFLPLVYVPVLLLSLGTMWMLSAVGVFLRDIAGFIGVGVQLLFFLTPIAYPLEAFEAGHPQLVTAVRWFNPLAAVIENARSVVVDGRLPDWMAMARVTVLSAAVAVFGYGVFIKLKRGFADGL
jgi:lipopolysaccharide transport system permease protein